jgi:hypothetical protein
MDGMREFLDASPTAISLAEILQENKLGNDVAVVSRRKASYGTFVLQLLCYPI